MILKKISFLGFKSEKDYTEHSALNHFISSPEYAISKAVVFFNTREVPIKGEITYLSIY